MWAGCLGACPHVHRLGRLRSHGIGGIGVEGLFTSALGPGQPPWVVEDVELDTSKRIDFEVRCSGAVLACPACGAAAQPYTTGCAVRGGTWTSSSTRPGCTPRCRVWPAPLAARPLRSACPGRVQDRASPCCSRRWDWRCAATCRCAKPRAAALPGQAVVAPHRALRRARRAPWTTCSACRSWASTRPACAGAELHHRGARPGCQAAACLPARDATTKAWWTSPPTCTAHGGEPAAVRHVCMDMSAAYPKGVALALPNARSATTASTSWRWPSRPWTRCAARNAHRARAGGRSAAGHGPQDASQGLAVGHAQEPPRLEPSQTNAMHWLQRSALKSARAWRLKMALREVYAQARQPQQCRAGRRPTWEPG